MRDMRIPLRDAGSPPWASSPGRPGCPPEARRAPRRPAGRRRSSSRRTPRPARRSWSATAAERSASSAPATSPSWERPRPAPTSPTSRSFRATAAGCSPSTTARTSSWCSVTGKRRLDRSRPLPRGRRGTAPRSGSGRPDLPLPDPDSPPGLVAGGFLPLVAAGADVRSHGSGCGCRGSGHAALGRRPPLRAAGDAVPGRRETAGRRRLRRGPRDRFGRGRRTAPHERTHRPQPQGPDAPSRRQAGDRAPGTPHRDAHHLGRHPLGGVHHEQRQPDAAGRPGFRQPAPGAAHPDHGSGRRPHPVGRPGGDGGFARGRTGHRALRSRTARLRRRRRPADEPRPGGPRPVGDRRRWGRTPLRGQHAVRRDLGGVACRADRGGPDPARAGGAAHRRRTGRAALPRRVALAPRLDELRELPYRGTHQPPSLGHPGRRHLRRAQAGPVTARGGRHEAVGLGRADPQARGPGGQVRAHHPPRAGVSRSAR